MRGEQVASTHTEMRALGPSPRARGADVTVHKSGAAPGTIPACAGSRSSSRAGCPRPRDHPRVRGEQSYSVVGMGAVLGPSPRARGAGGVVQVLIRVPGTIPACAGSRTEIGARVSAARDHPRVRGEQVLSTMLQLYAGGPSPRARGAAGGVDGVEVEGGTIPACAGSSRPCTTPSRASWDHPRVRGEQVTVGTHQSPGRGPSPRARGAGRGGRDDGRGDGTIPACAGSRW